VTPALDGSWGAGTADTQGTAIGSAFRKCNAMSGQKSDCGAEFTAIKRGWAIAFLSEAIVCLRIRQAALLRSRRQRPGETTWRLSTALTFRRVDTS
jgi:hypothetical protein